ncbi:MAG TPA: DUF4350 domain-containing protein [Verrucomicrobiae bacterium]|nr:DUF4350 domain-containing protein [Verrucomicrobiae bacterium]
MRKLPFIAFVLATLGFLYGLFYLFQLRFEAGDNYPEYSSLRADPMGSKALYESLQALTETQRHVRSLARLPDGPGTTLLFLGAEHERLEFSPAELKYLESFVRSGGRLVVTMFPAYQPRWKSAFPAPPARRTGSRAPPPGPPPPPPSPAPIPIQSNAPPAAPPGGQPVVRPPGAGPDTFETPRPVPITEPWGFDYAFAPLERDHSGKYQAVIAERQVADPSLPDRLPIHSALYFDKLNPAWRVLYARPTATNGLPVLVERTWGPGALVLAVDSYPFSNEALRHAPPAALLSWFVGPNRHVVFEEAHLGVSADPGVAALAREYRLGALFVALLVLAGLFVWKSSMNFLPPTADDLARERGNEVAGRDSASGLANLLARHVAPSEIMKICLEQWNEHVARHSRPSPARLEAMQKLIDAENARAPAARNPTRLYLEFCEILSKSKRS